MATERNTPVTHNEASPQRDRLNLITPTGGHLSDAPFDAPHVVSDTVAWREQSVQMHRLFKAIAEVAILQGGGVGLQQLMPPPGDTTQQFGKFEANLRQAITDPRRFAQLMAELEALPASTELWPFDVRDELTKAAREAEVALDKLGINARDVHFQIDVGYSAGKLGIFDRPAAGEQRIIHRKRAECQPLPERARSHAVAFELAQSGLVWLDHGRVSDATRALTDAQAILAPYLEYKRRGKRGGAGGAGTAKQPHGSLIRRAVAALAENGREVSAANVRLLLKLRWRTLAFEWGDPLHDIVDVRVINNGPIRFEYTARWALKHRNKRFIEVDADALKKQIQRSAK